MKISLGKIEIKEMRKPSKIIKKEKKKTLHFHMELHGHGGLWGGMR